MTFRLWRCLSLQLEEAGLETEEDEDMESKGIDLRLANVENLPSLFNF